MTDPATVHGSERNAIAFFVEDERGDLVDIEYVCTDCDPRIITNALWWPAFDFGTSGAYCKHCAGMIERPYFE